MQLLYFEKSQPAPDCLDLEKQKADGDYKCDCVLERIRDDFKNKCYICESAKPQTINVEHFRPHKGNKELKFSWSNLFWSCGHCNNIKLDNFDNIIDCTNFHANVEMQLEYEFNPFPYERVKIRPLSSSPEVESTAKLIELVFNGNTTLKKIEAANIRDDLLTEIQDFQSHLTEYCKDTCSGDDKEYFLRKIRGHLHTASAYVSFKRGIIRRNPSLIEMFGEYLT